MPGVQSVAKDVGHYSASYHSWGMNVILFDTTVEYYCVKFVYEESLFHTSLAPLQTGKFI